MLNSHLGKAVVMRSFVTSVTIAVNYPSQYQYTVHNISSQLGLPTNMALYNIIKYLQGFL